MPQATLCSTPRDSRSEQNLVTFLITALTRIDLGELLGAGLVTR